MKHLSEYRDAQTAKRLLEEIRRTVTRPWQIMEICGGQAAGKPIVWSGTGFWNYYPVKLS